MPFISIVVPSYNRANLLPRALRSLQQQTFSDFEIIVVDDGSTDETEHVVGEVVKEDARVRYVYQENAGGGAARNRGVQEARAKRVAFLDSDDEVVPTWLSTLREAFENGADVVCSGAKVIGENGKTKKTHLPREYGPARKHVRAHFFGSFAMRKSVFEIVGGYSEDFPTGQHTDFSLRLVWHPSMDRWKIHNIMEPLVLVHHHSGNQLRLNYEARYRGGRLQIEKHADKLRQDPAFFADFCGSVGVNAFRLGKRDEARSLLWKALVSDPTDWRRWARVLMAWIAPIGERVWNRS